MSHHKDTLADHMNDLGKDFMKHSPAEQRLIAEAVVEFAAGTMLKMTGNDRLGNALTDVAMQNAFDANLTGKDLADLYGTYKHLV